jgi:hypothetical protein
LSLWNSLGPFPEQRLAVECRPNSKPGIGVWLPA